MDDELSPLSHLGSEFKLGAFDRRKMTDGHQQRSITPTSESPQYRPIVDS